MVGGIVSPGNSPSALTVGASNTRGTAQRSDDVMATYSSRGPTAIDGLLKPELVAPGNRVVATAAPAAYLTKTYPERVVLGAGQGRFIEMSGTSMSTAVVSGAVALLLDARPLNPAGETGAAGDELTADGGGSHRSGCRPAQRRGRAGAGVGGQGFPRNKDCW